MPVNESLEYFPLYDVETGVDKPRVTAAIGSHVAVLGTPDAMAGAGAVTIYMYLEEENAWGYVGVFSGSKIGGSEQVRSVGSSLSAFGTTILVGAEGERGTPGRAFVLEAPYGMWSYTAIPVVTELTYPGATKDDGFGASVAYCNDGTDDYIAIGATGGTGRVLVYKGLKGAPVVVGNPDAAATEEDRFGASVAIRVSDGKVSLAVGAPGARGGQGSVYAGSGADPGSIRLGEPLAPTFADESQTGGFGTALALDGAMLAIGSPGDPTPDGSAVGAGSVWTSDPATSSRRRRPGYRARPPTPPSGGRSRLPRVTCWSERPGRVPAKSFGTSGPATSSNRTSPSRRSRTSRAAALEAHSRSWPRPAAPARSWGLPVLRGPVRTGAASSTSTANRLPVGWLPRRSSASLPCDGVV
jgi:hypothetical protein